MDLKKYPLLIVILLAILIVFGTLGSMNGWFDVAAAPIPLQITTKTYKENSANYTIYIEYPEFTGFRSSVTEKAANDKMNAFIMDQVSIFTTPPEGVAEGEIERGGDLTTRYSTIASSSDLISIAFANTFYDSGAAHPGNYTLTFNYLPDTGAFVSLQDIFTGEYLQALSTIAIQQITKELAAREIEADAAWVEKGAGPYEENFKAFALTKDSLTLYFDPYQVAPYAAGTFTVTIPFSELESVLQKPLPFTRSVSLE